MLTIIAEMPRKPALGAAGLWQTPPVEKNSWDYFSACQKGLRGTSLALRLVSGADASGRNSIPPIGVSTLAGMVPETGGATIPEHKNFSKYL